MQDKMEGEKKRVSWGPLYSFPKLIFLNSCVLLSRVCLYATPWTVTPQPPPSMEFSRQTYWSG